jgi:hypothetical protein
MEAAGLGLFMISAGFFGTLLEYPHSPVHQALAVPVARRALMSLAMGLTAVGIIYSPWGRRSGAHINPATPLTFWRLGKVAGRDAVGYAAVQFIGGLTGVLLVGAALGEWFLEPPVSAAATLPGSGGVLANEQERAQVAALAEKVQEATGYNVELAFVDQGYTGENAATRAAAGRGSSEARKSRPLGS